MCVGFQYLFVPKALLTLHNNQGNRLKIVRILCHGYVRLNLCAEQQYLLSGKPHKT